MGLKEQAHDALGFLTQDDHRPDAYENSLDVIGGVAGAVLTQKNVMPVKEIDRMFSSASACMTESMAKLGPR